MEFRENLESEKMDYVKNINNNQTVYNLNYLLKVLFKTYLHNFVDLFIQHILRLSGIKAILLLNSFTNMHILNASDMTGVVLDFGDASINKICVLIEVKAYLGNNLMK